MAFFHKGKLIKSATILGFGKSGRAVFEYLTKSYPHLPVSIRLQETRADLPEGVRIFTGENLFSDFYEDLVFVSPSIRRDRRELSGKLLSSDAELFFEISRHKIFAVTGSDGKSTTTSLAGLLLGDGARAIGNLRAHRTLTGRPFHRKRPASRFP